MSTNKIDIQINNISKIIDLLQENKRALYEVKKELLINDLAIEIRREF
jgi:hypothetical protein